MLTTRLSPSPTTPKLSPTAMCQSLNIRYELSEHTLEISPDGDASGASGASEHTPLPSHSLLSLYWEGRRLAGYRTIEQFYEDMTTEGWQIQSISRAHSRRQLHFAVMTRKL